MLNNIKKPAFNLSLFSIILTSFLLFFTFLPADNVFASSYGNTAKYCPQGDTSGTHCGTTFCDNTGIAYTSYGISNGNCTYHSWDCTGNSCGTRYNDHYWSPSCDKTDAQRNSSGAGPTSPPRCIPPPPSSLKCTTDSTGYTLTWNSTPHTTFRVYNSGNLLASPTTNSYKSTNLNIKSYTVKSFGGARENATGSTITCQGVISTVTPTKTPTPEPTATLTPTPTALPTPIPSPTASPTPTAGDTVFNLILGLDGLGSTGDNAAPNNSSSSNKNPLHKTRNVVVEVYNSNDSLILTKPGHVIYNSNTGKFPGTVNMGNALPSGSYTVKIKSDGYLKKIVPGVQVLTTTSSVNNVTLPLVNLVTGDTTEDNAINIIDYNIFISCSIYSSGSSQLCNTNSSYKLLSDIDDNGIVNEFDYNLFLREYSVQNGQ